MADAEVHIHVHVHHTADLSIEPALGRIEAALANQRQEITNMAQGTKDAVAKMESAVVKLTTEVDAVLAFIDANVQAQRDLAAELEADGQDATKLNALADGLEANRLRLAGKILANTPADPGTPLPDPVPVA